MTQEQNLPKEDWQKTTTDQGNSGDVIENQEEGNMQTQEENAADAEKTMAPVFQVTDDAGNPVVLSDFYGKPIVVNFWASWCGPCKSEMSDFQTAYETYGEDVHFLMINMTDGARETIGRHRSTLQRIVTHSRCILTQNLMQRLLMV